MAAAKPHFSQHAAFAADDDAVAGPGFAVFRLLLPPSFSDADTMRLYAAVNPLRRFTPALQVRVEPLDSSPSSSSECVAVVLGPTAPVRRVEASSSSGEPLALSPAQEALVAVISAEGALHRAEDGGRGGPGCVTCLLLVEAARLEAAAGRGTLGRIALEAGAGVRVAQWEKDGLPRGQPPEEVVEITGDRAAVRKALVALSSCLQGNLSVGTSTMSVKKQGSMLSLASSKVPEPNMGILCSEASTEHAQSNAPQIDYPQGVTGDVRTKSLQQISFRLLLPINLAGGLIGKKGSIIKGIEDETGACIDVSAPLSGCTERLITISALESPDSEYHTVQSALLRIFDRMVEVESNTRLMFDKSSQSSARVLFLKSQYGCLVGLGGSIIKEMVNATGARIQILEDTDVPACASNFELVLQITGELVKVRDALCLVCWKLRNHVFSSKSANYNNGYVPSSDIVESNATSHVNVSSVGQYSTDNFHTVDHGPSLSYGVDSVDKSLSAFELSSSEVQKADNGISVGINNSDNGEWSGNGTKNSNNGVTFPEDNSLVRGVETARITRITYETAVSGSILYLVYGDNGNNLDQLREISGADITVYDPPSEGNEAMVVVSGPPDHAQSAQRLLVDLILQGQ
ncbi:KH domain-containing protein HEN4-like isoform X1 [Phragmites australis]|uniref:KH domain-containing protein HEN4-like isoform X1 n=1 Tax=Phragmites australis TaxID=29695 RepID=UPI002D7891EC|nr:KH domain-containing protein HEN4-like isoform X1 [Phragmites australis]